MKDDYERNQSYTLLMFAVLVIATVLALGLTLLVTGSGYAVLGVFLFILLAFGLGGVRVVDQYERGVILTLGRYTMTFEPGLTWIFPSFQRMIKVDMRITTADIPQQEVITKDNVTVGVNAVVYFKVTSAARAVLEVQDFQHAIALYAQASLRDVIGGVELDTLLSERDKIADEIKKIVDVATDPWGIDVSTIKMQDIELPADMKRVMAKQAESERERRAIVIRAQGEFEASAKLTEAAKILAESPAAISLRTLSTIEKINPDPSKTVIFALPVEFMKGIQSITDKLSK